MLVEYKVRPVTRYIVTRYVIDGNGCASSQIGEYPNTESAELVANALVALDQSNGIDAKRDQSEITVAK